MEHRTNRRQSAFTRTDRVLDENRLFAIRNGLADRLHLAKELAVANEADVVVVLSGRQRMHIFMRENMY